jgi:hypothetical protein
MPQLACGVYSRLPTSGHGEISLGIRGVRCRVSTKAPAAADMSILITWAKFLEARRAETRAKMPAASGRNGAVAKRAGRRTIRRPDPAGIARVDRA